MTVKPEMFIKSLEYMGRGMLGILVVMAILIVVTLVLAKLPAGKKDSEDK